MARQKSVLARPAGLGQLREAKHPPEEGLFIFLAGVDRGLDIMNPSNNGTSKLLYNGKHTAQCPRTVHKSNNAEAGRAEEALPNSSGPGN